MRIVLYLTFLLLCSTDLLLAKQKVFGIGLSRTGTKSLNTALTVLGYKSAHFPVDDVTYEEMIHAQLPFSLLKKNDGITDISTIPYFIQLHKIYPKAKFILTVREKEGWLDGCDRHFRNKIPHTKMAEFLRSAVYGCIFYNRERFAHVYDEHMKRVLDYFEQYPDALLIMPICDGAGWEPLCEFLNEPIPDVAFPRIK